MEILTRENEVWSVIEGQIRRSKIKRYPYKKLLGESLTKVILRYKMRGYQPEETFNIILKHPNINNFLNFFPEEKHKLIENIKISVSARYGENNSSLKLYKEEFKK